MTDPHGEFVVDNLPWGAYMVCASKEDEGYADTIGALYVVTPPPTVVLSPSQKTVTVTVRLGPKAGLLDIQSVRDAVTGKRISDASVTIRRTDRDAFRTTAAQPGLLVPSLKDVEIQVQAEGYATWYYPGYTEPTKARPARLLPGERLTVTVELQPLVHE
jgi:hypothetical protein